MSATGADNQLRALRRLRDVIFHEALRCERLEMSDAPVRRGALIDMLGARVRFPSGAEYDECYVALVDPHVDAQWGHPAFWAFIPTDGEVVVLPTEFPQHGAGVVRMVWVVNWEKT